MRIAALCLAVLLSGCGTETNSARGPDQPQPLPDPTASAEYTEQDGMFLVEPVSATIQKDIRYRFEIHTHCGLDAAHVDIDGSLWDLAGPLGGGDSDRLPGFEDPSDEGTVELLKDDRLRFTSSGGTIVYFTRHAGSKKIPGCE